MGLPIPTALALATDRELRQELWRRREYDRAEREITAGPVVLDLETNQLLWEGRSYWLSDMEAKVAEALMHRHPKPYSSRMLAVRLYGANTKREMSSTRVAVSMLKKRVPGLVGSLTREMRAEKPLTCGNGQWTSYWLNVGSTASTVAMEDK